jgi:signal transduction histidine kinase
MQVQRLAAFVRNITKAPNPEKVVLETYQVLQHIAKVDRLRVVYSGAAGRWTEWKSTPDGLEVRLHDEWPAPEKKAATAFFDPETEHSGFISTAARELARSALEIVAPEVWAALLLRSAVERVQKASLSEAELARATLRARDEERRHIARELHDDLGQSLASLKLGLKWAEDHVGTSSQSVDVVHELDRARQDVAVMLEKIRDLSHTLYPRILDTLGLVSAVKELAHQALRSSPVHIQAQTTGKPKPLGRQTEIAIYRCCQEAISNAIRHSEAAKLVIRISFGRKEVRVTVEDDGKGFNPRTLYDSNSRMMSAGFWTIRQRMADIGGAFRVSTAEGQGTVVEMIVPYSAREAHGKGKDKSTHRG